MGGINKTPYFSGTALSKIECVGAWSTDEDLTVLGCAHLVASDGGYTELPVSVSQENVKMTNSWP
jgi:hypothetical protein